MEKKSRKAIWIIAVVVILALVIIGAVTCAGRKEMRVSTHTVTRQDIEVTVMATGYVQPVDKVDVGTQVSGVIEKIYVDFNSEVKKGELLAELDKSTLNEKVSQANASLASAQAEMTYAQQNYDRVKLMYDASAATQVAWEQAVNSLTQAKTSVVNAQANLHQARVNLSYADITSPIDGVVLNRAVDQGQTVAASFNTPTLFTIANDLTRMQVEADVDEADIGRIELGQKVNFTVDAFPDDTFTGTVNQIRLQPTVTNNVVTYIVIIEAPNPDSKLYPGMTANINIAVESENGLAIPMEALSFRMTEEVAKELGVAVPERRPMNAVWVKTAGSAELRQVEPGIDDGVTKIVLSGLNEGDQVILSAGYEKKSENKGGQAASNPLMPSRGGRR